jgi:hypothetical protein
MSIPTGVSDYEIAFQMSDVRDSNRRSSDGSSCFRYCDFDHMCDRNRIVGRESRARSVEADRTITAGKGRQDLNSYGGNQQPLEIFLMGRQSIN